jgi:hypothetical protein
LLCFSPDMLVAVAQLWEIAARIVSNYVRSLCCFPCKNF